MLKFVTFSRAVNDRPYEWMTIDSPKFDGARPDNHHFIMICRETTSKLSIVHCQLSILTV